MLSRWCSGESILKTLSCSSDKIRLSEAFETSGISLFKSAKKLGLEGIIAKNKQSVYHENDRSRDWLKIKSTEAAGSGDRWLYPE